MSEDDNTIITRPYPRKVEDICVNKGERIKPHAFFQRNFVWGIKRQSLLIETMLRGLPIPAIYTYLEQGTNFENVIDGQQRLITIKKFLNNGFELKGLEILKFLEGLQFYQLPQKYQNKLLTYLVNFIRFENICNKKDLFDIFKRYNTGALELNAQEIRNGMYSGKYNDFIKDVAKYKPFNTYIASCSDINRMIAEELVVRFMAMYEKMEFYRPKMNNFINKHYESKAHLDDLNKNELYEKLKDETEVFKTAFDACESVFKKCTFKQIVKIEDIKSKNTFYYGRFSKFVFDMQMLGFAFGEIDLGKVIRKADKIKSEYEHLILNQPEMVPSTYNDNAQTAKRIKYWQERVYKIINS